MKKQLRNILENFQPAYETSHGLTPQQRKVLGSIKACKTERLGKKLYRCEDGVHEHIVFHSCRDRHCPHCQHRAREQWIDKRLERLLPVKYYHVVFTLPSEFRVMVMYNRELIYNLLLIKVAEVLKEFFADPRYIGGIGGFMAILHTWGQMLQFHPHVHLIIPAVGLSDAGEWILPKRREKDFLFPRKALSIRFRGKFLKALGKLYKQGKLKFPDLSSEVNFQDDLYMAAAKNWNVFIKKPFEDARHVVKYIGRYSHRIAITDSRIISSDNRSVQFRYKDYRQQGTWKEADMDGLEFVKRYINHILPAGFKRIRYYGFECSKRAVDLRDKLISLLKELNIVAVAHCQDTDRDKQRHEIRCTSCSRLNLIRFMYPVFTLDSS